MFPILPSISELHWHQQRNTKCPVPHLTIYKPIVKTGPSFKQAMTTAQPLGVLKLYRNESYFCSMVAWWLWICYNARGQTQQIRSARSPSSLMQRKHKEINDRFGTDSFCWGIWAVTIVKAQPMINCHVNKRD